MVQYTSGRAEHVFNGILSAHDPSSLTSIELSALCISLVGVRYLVVICSASRHWIARKFWAARMYSAFFNMFSMH